MFTEAVITCEKAYIEIMEYHRADKAKIVYTETGKIDEIKEGVTSFMVCDIIYHNFKVYEW